MQGGLLNEMVNKNRELQGKFVKERLGESAVSEEADVITGEPAEPIQGEVPPKEGEGEKVYLGHKGDIKYFMVMGGGDIKVEDEEGKEVLSAQAEGIDTSNINAAVREILKSTKLSLDEVDYNVHMTYIEPLLAEEAGEEKAEEEGGSEPAAEEPPAEEPTVPEESKTPAAEGKAPAIPPKDETTLVKELMESGAYDVLAAEIMSKDIAEDLAKGKEAHVVEDIDGAFGSKGKFVVIKARAAVKEGEQPAVPPQKGEDPVKGAKMGATGQTETQPAVPPQKGDDVNKGAKIGATGQTETQPTIPPQKGEEVTKGPDTTSVKKAETNQDGKLTLEKKKKEEDDKKKKADELKKKHGLKK